MNETPNTYGARVERSAYNPERSLIQSPSVSHAGNVILRVGREWDGGESWHQTEHVVLTPTEALQLLRELNEVIPEAQRRAVAEGERQKAARA